MVREKVSCPRCGSTSIYYHDVSITVDYDYLTWEDGKLVWTQDTYDREYFDVPDDLSGFHDGSVKCDRPVCGAFWPDLEALEAECLVEERAEAALVSAEERQLGAAGNYVGIEMY